MSRIFLFFFVHLFFAGIISAQGGIDTSITPLPHSVAHKDSSVIRDSLPLSPLADSVSKRPVIDTGWKLSPGSGFALPNISAQIIQHHPFFGFGREPLQIKSGIKEFNGKEILFYVLVTLLLLFGFLRQAFPKYFSDLFRLFFRTTLKQRQISEQLMQTPLPSLLLNVFFVASGGLYINFILHYYRTSLVDNFWLLFLYCVLGLSVIYFLKFVGLKFSGWLFRMRDAANSYIFIVFVVNKIIGIFLLPFLVLLAFMNGPSFSIAMVISWCCIGGLLFYRVVLTFAAVRNQVKVNPFHFFLYLCAFEIAPLLLIYKGLLLLF